MQSVFDISPDALASCVGISVNGGTSRPADNRTLKMKLGIIQRISSADQMKAHGAVAAKYLPALMEKFKETDDVLSAATTLLNVISATPYFARFCTVPAGTDITTIQANRTAGANLTSRDVDEVGEISQFLSTLFVLQGIDAVDDGVKATLIPKLEECKRIFRGRLASKASERCLALLKGDPEMQPMMEGMKSILTVNLKVCGESGCQRNVQNDGAELMQCARCKVAVYCGSEHQKKAWPAHKPTCFESSF